MWNARLDEAQAGIKIAGRNINNLRYADDTILMAESKEELKNFWWGWKGRLKKRAWKSTLKELTSWHPFPSLQIEGRKVEVMKDFIFCPYSQSYHFSSSHEQMWELDSTKDWVLKNSCFWTVVLKKTAKSPLESKEIKSGSPKGNQSWIFIGRTDAEAETPILWPPDSLEKSLILGKTEGRRRGDDRGWDGWMTSLTQWTWVWGNSQW